jgi:hypothetical protein
VLEWCNCFSNIGVVKGDVWHATYISTPCCGTKAAVPVPNAGLGDNALGADEALGFTLMPVDPTGNETTTGNDPTCDEMHCEEELPIRIPVVNEGSFSQGNPDGQMPHWQSETLSMPNKSPLFHV